MQIKDPKNQLVSTACISIIALWNWLALLEELCLSFPRLSSLSSIFHPYASFGRFAKWQALEAALTYDVAQKSTSKFYLIEDKGISGHMLHMDTYGSIWIPEWYLQLATSYMLMHSLWSRVTTWSQASMWHAPCAWQHIRHGFGHET